MVVVRVPARQAEDRQRAQDGRLEAAGARHRLDPVGEPGIEAGDRVGGGRAGTGRSTGTGTGPGPGLLFRAVALPFAPEAGDGTSGMAVALLSWRHLLPAAETAALYRELRAAIGWMDQNSR